jgi:hypothetical protein
MLKRNDWARGMAQIVEHTCLGNLYLKNKKKKGMPQQGKFNKCLKSETLAVWIIYSLIE